jgi:hypothetical protein
MTDAASHITVFASGSCRILHALDELSRSKSNIKSVHSMKEPFFGANFMGKLHNTKQHIQFFKYLKGDITIPEPILEQFLTCYDTHIWPPGSIQRDNPANSLETIRRLWDSIDYFLIEICSIKYYGTPEYALQMELLPEESKKIYRVQTAEEIKEDLLFLARYLGKPIIFACHIRPHLIDNQIQIPERTIIYEAIKDVIETTGLERVAGGNTATAAFGKTRHRLLDPTDILIKYGKKHIQPDLLHWRRSGLRLYSNQIYQLLMG